MAFAAHPVDIIANYLEQQREHRIATALLGEFDPCTARKIAIAIVMTLPRSHPKACTGTDYDAPQIFPNPNVVAAVVDTPPYDSNQRFIPWAPPRMRPTPASDRSILDECRRTLRYSREF